MNHDPEPASRVRWWTLALVSVTTFMLMLDLSVAAIALPDIQRSFHAGFSGIQWVFDAYALTLAAFLVTSGSVADRTGRKRLFLVGLAVFIAASLACGLSGSIEFLNVSRGVQGAGAAILYAVGPALLGHEFHGKERAVAFSAFGAAVGLAVATGPLIGGALTGGPGWRWIFFINVPIGLVAGVAAMKKVRESRSASRHPSDFLGMAMFTVSLAAIILAVIRGNRDGWYSGTNVTLYVVSAASMVAFLVIARARGERAMVDLSMFRNPTFAGIAVVALLCNCGTFPTLLIETNLFQGLLGNSSWGAGLHFLPMTLAMFVFGAVTGGLIGRVPYRILLAGAAAFMGAGLLLGREFGVHDGWTALIPTLIVTGIGFGMFNPVRSALAIGVFEPARSGVASGINETFQQVGAGIGIAVIGAFFENRVTSSFAASASGSAYAGATHSAGSAIAAGSITPTAEAAGPVKAAAALANAHSAFVSAFHDAMVLGAVIALAGAVLALLLIRGRDMHPSALGAGIPPEVDGEWIDAAESASSPTEGVATPAGSSAVLSARKPLPG